MAGKQNGVRVGRRALLVAGSLLRDRRFVDNGKFLAAGGLTSGIDAALHVIERYRGEAPTEQLAAYMEHFSTDWKTGAPQTT